MLVQILSLHFETITNSYYVRIAMLLRLVHTFA